MRFSKNGTYLAVFLAVFSLSPALAEEKLTLQSCYEDDREGYCFWDLAEQEQDFSYCDYYDSPSSFTECFDGVAKLRKATEEDCLAVEKHRDLCLKKVREI